MASSYKDYYKLLGVDKTAKPEEISKSFKKLARKYHPDLNPGDKKAEEKFKEINEAYEVLKDAEKRKKYDQFGPEWEKFEQAGGAGAYGDHHFHFNGQDMGSGDFADIFETLFGGGGGSSFSDGFGGLGGFGRKQGPRRGRDVEAELPLTLAEVFKGGKRKVTLQMPGGPKTLEVNVPPGIKDGARMRLAGQGDPSPDGGKPGDLFLIVKYLPDPDFKVVGDNIHSQFWLAPWEAVLGTKVPVKTLDGEIELNVPAGTSSGRKFRLKGKGMGAASKRGDLLLEAMIGAPKELSPQEKELWDKLAEISTYKPRV